MSNITIYYQNVRGLRTKTSDLFNSVLSENYQVLIFSETWLNDSLSSSEIIDNRYIVYRRDRDSSSSSKSRGGGVLIAVDKCLISCILDDERSAREELWVRLRTQNGDLLLCAVYIPPQSSYDIYRDHLRRVESVLDLHHGSDICIVGDFNLPNIRWLTGACETIPVNVSPGLEGDLCDFLCYLGLVQCNHVLNKNNVVLDLVLCTSSSVTVSQTFPLIAADNHHPPIIIDVCKHYVTPLRSDVQYRFDFKRAD